jgi:hypothetical protein
MTLTIKPAVLVATAVCNMWPGCGARSDTFFNSP